MKSLKENKPISNEREWDKKFQIPERASLVGDEPRRPKSLKKRRDRTMTRKKGAPGSRGDEGVFKTIAQSSSPRTPADKGSAAGKSRSRPKVYWHQENG